MPYFYDLVRMERYTKDGLWHVQGHCLRERMLSYKLFSGPTFTCVVVYNCLLVLKVSCLYGLTEKV